MTRALWFTLYAVLMSGCSASVHHERYTMITPCVAVIEGAEPGEMLEPDEGYLYMGWLWFGLQVKGK